MGSYLTFSISGELCAVGISDVETVLEDADLSRVSGGPRYLAGLLDHRGEAVPVIDVRKKLGLEPRADAGGNCIIVLSLPGDGGRKPVGALVDSVSEVIELADSSISPSGGFAIAFDEHVVKGIAKGERGFITMIAAEKLFEAPAVLSA